MQGRKVTGSQTVDCGLWACLSAVEGIQVEPAAASNHFPLGIMSLAGSWGSGQFLSVEGRGAGLGCGQTYHFGQVGTRSSLCWLLDLKP